MKLHISDLATRMLRAGLRVHACRYKVVCVGIDGRDRIISIATNAPRLERRGWHAEERLLHKSPRSLVRIVLARFNARGEQLPIHACSHCQKLARKRGVKIERL